MMSRARVCWLLVVAALLIAGPGCNKMLEEALNDALGLPEKEPLTGQNAFVYLKVDDSKSSGQDTEALKGALKLAGKSSTESEDTFDPGDAVVGELLRGVRARQGIRSEKFVTYDFTDHQEFGDTDGWGGQGGSVDISALKADYLVPHLNAIPVRNQGGRGTCAAFAGIGHIEFSVLREMPGLHSIDLSEQRFYYTSKPYCQSSGCTKDDEGSWYGVGMDASVAASTFDIPLEADCPYNSEFGANDVQIPQAAGCDTGAVKVAKIKEVWSPEEILDVLENDGLPVPYGSKLSDNWYYNEGLITLAESDYVNIDQHSGGHAYLIVGYRTLPNMPDEGGMCFIVKNSWGPGWAVNGYSCQTVAWMEKWGYAGEKQPIAMDVLIRDDILPSIEDDTQPEPIPDIFDEDTYDDETVNWDDLDEGDEEEIPEPDPVPVEPTWASCSILGPDSRYYQADCAKDPATGKQLVFGYVRNTDKTTGVLELEVQGSDLYYDGDQVGEIKGDELTLCTGPYDVLCSLRLHKGTNDLYVEFVNPEYRRVKPEELTEGEWEDLATPLGFNIQFFTADTLLDQLASDFMFVRLVDKQGAPTEAMRLAMDGLDVRLMGETVGSVSPDKMGLCSGTYENRCRMFVGKRGLTIVPRPWKKGK